MTLLIREGATIRISDSDQDDWVRNRASTLVELRAAPAVWVLAAFAVATLPL